MSAEAPPRPAGAAAAGVDTVSATAATAGRTNDDVIAAAASRLGAAAASLPSPGLPFSDASASPAFRRDMKEIRERSVKLLERILEQEKQQGKGLVLRAGDDDDPRAARDAVARALDPLVEKLEREKREEAEGRDGDLHAPSWGRSGGDGGGSPPAVPSPSSSARPQDAFDPPVDNARGVPFRPPRAGWLACCAVADGCEGGGRPSPLDDDGGDAAADAAAAAQGPSPRRDGNDARCSYHPLERVLSSLSTCVEPWQLERVVPKPPPPLHSTPFAFVDSPAALDSLVQRWLSSGVREVAFDLEAHSFHSFQGFTCLIQLSTRREDAVVDAIALRSCVGPLLAPLLADPKVAKVAHGARHDVSWLQRDFGLFISNLFDTGVAAALVGRPRGLGALYKEMLGLTADKKWQTADWRLRPLPRAALLYAREDTHWLLHVSDVLKSELVAKANGELSLLKTAFESSRQLCLARYEAETFSRRRALAVAATVGGGVRSSGVSSPAREVFVSLCDWRDRKARELDESTGAVLPKGVMAKIAKRAAEKATAATSTSTSTAASTTATSSAPSFDAAALRSAVGSSPCMVFRYTEEVVEAAREGIRRWERLRSGEITEADLEDEDDDDGGEERREGDGGDRGGRRDGGKTPAPAAAAPAAAFPEARPMLLDPSAAGANNAVPFNRRGAAAAATTTTSADAPKRAAAAVAPAPPSIASSFFAPATAARKKPPSSKPSLSMPLAFAPRPAAPAAVAPAPPPPPPTTKAEEKQKKSENDDDDFVLPVPLGDLRPGAQRANKGKKGEEATTERRTEDAADEQGDAAVAAVVAAGRRAMEVSDSSSEEDDSDSDSESGDDGAPEEAAVARPPAPKPTTPATTTARAKGKKRPSPASSSFDFEAKIAASPGLVMASEAPAPADGGRGRGGRGGRGGGRGRGRGRGESSRDLLPAGPAPPRASFDPYALNRLGEIKGGKKSATAPRTGNKSHHFV